MKAKQACQDSIKWINSKTDIKKTLVYFSSKAIDQTFIPY